MRALRTLHRARTAAPGRVGRRGQALSEADPPPPGLAELAARFRLDAAAARQLRRLQSLLVSDPHAPTSLRDPRGVVDGHLADSLVGLEVEGLHRARQVVDVGSGAGLPGLPLAIALPGTRFVLLESNGRKCDFIRRAAQECEIGNAEVVQARVEEWPEGRHEFDAALFRAVGPLEVVVEYGAPLLGPGGCLIVWRGSRDLQAEQRAARAAGVLGLRASEVRQVHPYPESRDRNLHLFSRVRDLPEGFPRRAGMAMKRPLGQD